MNNQMMMNNGNIQPGMINYNNQMMNNQMGMYTETNQIKMKELLEELDFMRNKVNLYEKRIKTLEERIKEKDSEINNLKFRLNSYCNPIMQQPYFPNPNYNYQNNNNCMMMGQMNNVNNAINPFLHEEKSPKDYMIYFIINDKSIGVHGKSDMTIKKLIKYFRIKLCKENLSLDYFFKGKKLDIDSNLTLEQYGILNEYDIYVVEKNDKIAIEEISKISSYKHENITIEFTVSNGHKLSLSLSKATRISKAFKLFCEKALIGEDGIKENIMFIFNGKRLDIDNNKPIGDICLANSMTITVFDQANLLGA